MVRLEESSILALHGPNRSCLEYVNMSAGELEEWLKSSDSEGAGWTGGGDGETVGKPCDPAECC